MGHALTSAALLAALAAVPRPAPLVVPDADVTLDGSAAAFAGRPADLALRPVDPGGRTGRVWLAATESALVVTGEVDGPAPALARTEAQLLAGDHVEVWLAGPRDPVLPPLGWGNQFGEETLTRGEASCAAWAASDRGDHDEARCRAWVRAQGPHRAQLRRLFVRRWLLGDGIAVEAFATPALAEVVRRTGRLDADIAPRGGVRMLARTDPGRPGYTFQVEIPFASFPPLDDLELRGLRVRVDVSSAACPGRTRGARSTTSPGGRQGSPASFTPVRLARPRQLELTPCRAPLRGRDAYGAAHAAWFLPPREGATLDEAFLVVNPVRGYQYAPALPSPSLRRARYFSRPVAPGEWVCGPELAIRRGEAVHRTGLAVAEDGLDARRLDGETLLVKSGPRTSGSEFGAGQCGACPRWEVSVFAIAPDGAATTALALDGVTEPGVQETDVAVAPDWTSVTVFERRTDDGLRWEPWKADRYCLSGHRYAPCAAPPDASPPASPVLPLRSAP